MQCGKKQQATNGQVVVTSAVPSLNRHHFPAQPACHPQLRWQIGFDAILQEVVQLPADFEVGDRLVANLDE